MIRRITALVGILILLTILIIFVWAVYRHRTNAPLEDNDASALASQTSKVINTNPGGYT